MKQPVVTPIRESAAVTVAATNPPDNSAHELRWIDEVAELLPEDSRLGWYKNVRPWLRMLPPDDEVAHLAYSMGYLALLTRQTPEHIATERAKLAAIFRSATEEMTTGVKTTVAYHKQLNDRLSALPEEIVKGLSPAAVATEIVEAVKEQFLQSGVSEAGRQLKEQGDRLRQLVSGQYHELAQLRQQMNDSRSHTSWVLDNVTAAADSAKKSIDLWNGEMRRVQWTYMSLILLIGVLLGALFYWWVTAPVESAGPQHSSATNRVPPSAAASGRSSRSDSK